MPLLMHSWLASHRGIHQAARYYHLTMPLAVKGGEPPATKGIYKSLWKTLDISIQLLTAHIFSFAFNFAPIGSPLPCHLNTTGLPPWWPH